jgi:hypothetical protein
MIGLGARTSVSALSRRNKIHLRSIAWPFAAAVTLATPGRAAPQAHDAVERENRQLGYVVQDQVLGVAGLAAPSIVIGLISA